MPSHVDWLTARPIAHRGFHDVDAGRPENTLAAFRAAIDNNYAIECDLQISADGVPIVFHDNTLDRLSDESGPVRSRSAAVLCGIRLAGTAETIPRLSDLLALTAGRVPLVLELKSQPDHDDGFAASVVSTIRNYNGPLTVMSFGHGLLAALRRLEPGLVCGLTAQGDWRTTWVHLQAIRRLRLQFLSYKVADLPTPAATIARRVLRLPLICWTVKSPADAKRAYRLTDQITFEGFAA